MTMGMFHVVGIPLAKHVLCCIMPGDYIPNAMGDGEMRLTD